MTDVRSSQDDQCNESAALGQDRQDPIPAFPVGGRSANLTSVMKRIFFVIAILGVFGAIEGFGAKPIKVKNWSGVQTYDVATLKKNMDSQIRKVVGARFAFRGKDIHHMKPNWYESSIWQPNPNGKGFVDVRVMVAKKDLPAFKSITTKPGGPEMVLYGKVAREVEGNFFFVGLIGRNPNVDAAGNGTITW